MRSCVTEEVISIQVEREPLQEASNIEELVATPREHFHAVVEPLDKAACLPLVEVIRDLVHPLLERPKEAVELDQPTGTHPLGPRPHRALGPRFRTVALEEFRQVFPQVVCRREIRLVGEDPLT
jgi:hypothetical protein